MTENKAKRNTRKTLLWLVLADLLVIGIAALAVISVLPLFSVKHIKNTSDALFFDSSKIADIISGNAFEFSAELIIPDKYTEFGGDLHLSADSARDKVTDNGKAAVYFCVGDKSISLDLFYDSETVALAGLSADKSTPVSLPRRGLKEAFDKSKFYFVSGSLHSMSMSQYNSLIPALDSALDPDSEADADAFSDIVKDIIKTVDPTSSFTFSKGKLCRRFTYVLDADKTVSILGLFTDLDEEQISAMKDSIGGKTVILTYLTDGNYITSAQISSESIEADIEFLYDRNANGFNADVIYTFDSSGEAIGVVGKTKYELTYFKTVTDSEITADLTVWSPSEGSRDYSLSLNKNDSSYSLKLNENEIATGVCELDGEKLNLTVKNSETASELVSLMLRKVEKVVTEIPEHRSLFDMSEDELTEFFRGIPIKTASDMLKTLSGLDLSAYMTADGKLLMHADKIMSEAQKLYGSYVSLLKSTEKKLIDSVSKIYVWNDRLKAYILFTYLRDTDSLELGCAYELTEEILAEYHVANLTYNGIMSAHSIKLAEKVDPTCDAAGREVYKCEHCDYGYQTDYDPLGHKYANVYIDSTTHNGDPKTLRAYKCTRCELITELSADAYFKLMPTPDGNGGYAISNYNALKGLGFAYLYVPSTDIKFSGITVNQSDGSFEAINIPEGIEKLSASSIYLSRSFKVLVLPSTLKEIEPSAFYGYGSPSVIFYSGSEEEWSRLSLGEYSSLWANSEIIFCPSGVTHSDISKKLFLSSDLEKAASKQKQMLLSATAAVETAKNESVTLISEEKIAFADYDEDNSLAAYCGVSVGFKTTVEIFDTKSGKTVDSFVVNDQITTLAIREGYVAMGGDYSTTVYVYDIKTKQTAKFKIDTEGKSDSIGKIFIDSGYVYASAKNTYYLAAYSIADARAKVILHPGTMDSIVMFHKHHRIIVVKKYYSSIYLALIDTKNAAYIKEITYSESITSSYIEVPTFENVIVNYYGTAYDFDGNITAAQPLNTPDVKVNIPSGNPIAETIYEGVDGAAVLFAESGQKILLALQKRGSDKPLILDYYAEAAIVTKEGNMIVYTPGSYGLLLVELP